MVAITVILAAVIGTFVLGLGDQVSENPPNTQWSVSENLDNGNADTIEFVHDGGDAVDGDNLIVRGDALETDPSDPTELGIAGDRLTAGDSFEADVSDSANAGDGARLVWSPSGSDTTSTLTTYSLSNDGGS